MRCITHHNHSPSHHLRGLNQGQRIHLSFPGFFQATQAKAKTFLQLPEKHILIKPS